jgi:hypothetical protein
MTVGALQELHWRKEMTLEEMLKRASEEDYFHQVITHEIAKLIMAERSGILMWLYGYFSVLHKPVTPIEFFVFWQSLADCERTRFSMFAIRNMP